MTIGWLGTKIYFPFETSNSLRNMDMIRYSTQMMPAVKEPVTFTLNTE